MGPPNKRRLLWLGLWLGVGLCTAGCCGPFEARVEARPVQQLQPLPERLSAQTLPLGTPLSTHVCEQICGAQVHDCVPVAIALQQRASRVHCSYDYRTLARQDARRLPAVVPLPEDVDVEQIADLNNPGKALCDRSCEGRARQCRIERFDNPSPDQRAILCNIEQPARCVDRPVFTAHWPFHQRSAGSPKAARAMIH